MGERHHRPANVSHDFSYLKKLKAEWGGQMHRVRLGKHNFPYIHMRQWCVEHPGRFYTSEAYEVFYFEDPITATMFKLRWHDAVQDSTAKTG